jgi:TyrR family helix-turn-helix protein/PAS domain S-box-containing protein
MTSSTREKLHTAKGSDTAGSEMASYRSAKLQFDTIFNFTSYGIWILDGTGNVLNVNPVAERLIGIQKKDVVGKNIIKLVENGVINEALTPYVLAAKRPISRVLHVLKTNKHIFSTGTPVLDEDGNVKLVVVNEYDMTTLNNLQTQLEQMRNVAEKYRDVISDLGLHDLKDQSIIAKSRKMQNVMMVSRKLSRFGVSNILILGESGTGKGLVARFIHEKSKRRKHPFVQINCAALPEGLLEAELFGFEKGAFTGASDKGKIGLFELAQGGTLLLDEIGDLPLPLQAKLLKCLDDGEIMHLGGLKTIRIDCIIIAATNQDLHELVKKRRFREDLYHRLNVFKIEIPPLRERPEDIFELSKYFLRKYNREFKSKKRFSPTMNQQLHQYAFPGNVRELKNIIKSAVVMSETDLLQWAVMDKADEDMPSTESILNDSITQAEGLMEQMEEIEKKLLENAMVNCASTRELARHLKTSQSTIVRKLRKYGLEKRP